MCNKSVIKPIYLAGDTKSFVFQSLWEKYVPVFKDWDYHVFVNYSGCFYSQEGPGVLRLTLKILWKCPLFPKCKSLSDSSTVEPRSDKQWRDTFNWLQLRARWLF